MAFDIRDEDDPHNEEFAEYEDIKQPAPTKFYRRRKFWMFCIPNLIIALIVAVVLALYVIMPKIAQHLMNNARINFSEIDIANVTATSMDVVIRGDLQNTGPFHADISFPGTVVISWNGIELGTTEIPGKSTASGGHGTLDLQSSVTISNSTAFTEFSSYMLNADSFVWHLAGKLDVRALSRNVKNLDLSKDITVNAFKGLSGVSIQKFSLPGDDPSGKGINVEIETTLTNPSALQLYMGSLTLAISYKDTVLGYVTAQDLTMVRGPQTLSLKGILIPQNTTEGLAVVSDLMSRYIGNVMTDTIATGYEVMPDGVHSVDWLSSAVQNLKLTVPLQSPQPLQLIKALNLGALGLVFTPPTAYLPVATSTGVLANYSLPDGFNFNIQFTQVSNTFTLVRNNTPIASLNSSYNPATSDMAAGTLNFNLLASTLVIPDASHEAFQEFNRDLTIGENLPFNVIGNASVFANTSIGIVNLVNIPFNASTELSGLQSLANPAPTITSLQVVTGTATDLTMAITVIIVNPSSISLSTGDIVLNLVYKDVVLGTVTMPNLAIVPGANTINATSTINPAASPEGLELLTLYTSGAGASVNIVGTPTSTAVDSLSLAFGALSIGSQIPGLETKLLAGASLVVLDTTLVNGIAQTVVTINNPFVPPMSILSIDSTITYSGATVGTVVSTFDQPIVVPGTAQGSLTAGLALNTNPTDLVTLIRAQAVKNGLNTDAFDGLLSLQSGGNPPASLFENFNVGDFVIKAMSGLVVDITLTTTVKVGDYQVTIPYTQTGVPTATDQSVLKLIPIVGTPIAQVLVEGSVLAFDSIVINSPAETSFATDLSGAITNTGPLDAQIAFPNAVVVSYNGKAIGSMMMPTLNATANKGASLNLTGVAFTVTDVAAFSDFNVFALNNEKFEWVISTDGLVVTAMGVALPGVSMNKTITLDGFNKLAGLVLNSYIINTIDDAGMHMVISATLANPSTIGMTIPLSTFDTGFHGQTLGPAVAAGLVLVPHGSSSFALNATIATGLGDFRPILAGIFQNAIGGVATPLDAQGTGAPGVSWLDAAIKSLKLSTSLPPLASPPIESVNVDAMSVDFACATCTWAPGAVASISAKTNLPFAGNVPIVQLSQHVEILDQNGQLVGKLDTPYAPAAATGSIVTTTTPSVPLVVDDGSHDIYEGFIRDLNAATTYQMGLRGTTDSILDLGALGMVEVKGIVIDVFAPVAGLQGLKQVDFIASLSATFDLDTLAVVLNAFVDIHNPSNLTLNIGDLHLTAVSDYVSATKAGYALIKSLTLVPGDNRLVATSAVSFNDPAGGDLASAILSSTDPIPFLMIALDDATSNVALNAGLNQLQTSVLLPPGLLEKAPANPPYSTTDMALKFLPTTVDDGLVQMTMKFLNPFIGSGYSFLHMVNPHDSDADPRGVIKGSSKVFELLDDLTFSLSGNNTATVTFNIKLHADPTLDRSFYQSLVTESASGNVQLIMNFNPVITLGQDPTEYAPFWTSQIIASGTGGVIPFKAGSDFGLILDWYDKQFPAIVAVPTVATPSPTSTTDVAMPTSLAASPSPVATTTADPAPPAITVV